jgi:hypothetical protein
MKHPGKHYFKTGFILIVLALILYSTCFFQKSTEDKFREEAFRLDPFLYKKEIAELSNFLLINADTLVNYHQHTDYREIQLDEGTWNGGYTKEGDCFSIATFREQFICEYFPAFLIDSFYHYLGRVEPKIITSITICTKNSDYSVSKNSGSISFAFNYEQKDIRDGSYHLYHGLYFNAEFTPNNKLKDEYDMLAKDTLLIDELRYGIWVTPNTGW